MKQAGYDAVELQIADPEEIDESRMRRSLEAVGFSMCALQTGATYHSRGNCLCTCDETVRWRTVDLLKSFVELAARFRSVIVFGSLQGQRKNGADLTIGRKCIIDAMSDVCRHAVPRNVMVAFEPVNHLETAYHNTIEEVYQLVQIINLPSARLMIDTFHMNIEEKDMLLPFACIRDMLAHVHLSETNRDVLGSGHLDTRAFLDELCNVGYRGYVSVGVYNTRLSRRECIHRCMKELQKQSMR